MYPAHAAGLDDAVRLYEGGDYAAAYPVLLSLAEKDQAEAQYYLGLMHLNGQGVEQNVQEALPWLRKAALGGVMDAAATLGKMYASGLGVKMDMDEAAKWIERAGEIAEALGMESEC